MPESSRRAAFFVAVGAQIPQHQSYYLVAPVAGFDMDHSGAV